MKLRKDGQPDGRKANGGTGRKAIPGAISKIAIVTTIYALPDAIDAAGGKSKIQAEMRKAGRILLDIQ